MPLSCMNWRTKLRHDIRAVLASLPGTEFSFFALTSTKKFSTGWQSDFCSTGAGIFVRFGFGPVSATRCLLLIPTMLFWNSRGVC